MLVYSTAFARLAKDIEFRSVLSNEPDPWTLACRCAVLAHLAKAWLNSKSSVPTQGKALRDGHPAEPPARCSCIALQMLNFQKQLSSRS